MTAPELSQDRIFATLDATWPAAETTVSEGWRLRTGFGGGKRVSATTRKSAGAKIARAEAAMDRAGQDRLFMLRPGDNAGDTALDAALDAAGYLIVDPTLLKARQIAPDCPPDPDRHVIECAAPLAIACEIWAEGGVGPARLAVMARAHGPKCVLLARSGDTPAGVAFVALNDGLAMLHAVEVAAAHRRAGLGRRLGAAALHWAARHEASHLLLAVTRANAAANMLYDSVGFQDVARYHYRLQRG